MQITENVATMLAQGQIKKTVEHKTNLDAADFQKLFLEQMMHQDPLSPMDQKDMMGQLAQLMEMSRNNETNELLKSMKDIESTRNRLDSGALLGKHVMADASKVEVEDGKARISWNLPEAGRKVTVDVYKQGTLVARWDWDSNMTVRPGDKNGEQAKAIAEEMTGQGVHSVIWDGHDSTGQKVADGTYNVVVRAANKSNNMPMPNAGPAIEGTVKTVGLTGDNVSFNLEVKQSDPNKQGEMIPIRTDQIYQILPNES